MTYKTFDQYDEAAARGLLSGIKTGSTAFRARKFYDGYHLWSRDEWRGPRPAGRNAAAMWLEIERGFVSQNVVKEACERHTFGVLGREPMWAYVTGREARRRAKSRREAESPEDKIMLPWWDDERLLLVKRKATTNLLLTGSGAYRLHFSPSEPRRVLVTVPEPGQARVYRDPLTGREMGVYSYTAGGRQFTEVCYLNAAGRTVVKTLAEGSEGFAGNIKEMFAKALSAVGVREADVVPEAEYDLGGRLTIYEMSREPLIDEQVLQNQCLLNMALTMLPRNVVLGGFLERIMVNIQSPKKRDAAGKETDEDDDYQAGAGAVTFAKGLPRYGEDGELLGYESGNVIFRDPISVKTFEDTKRVAYEGILGQCHQKHILDPGTGEFGAEARKQARDDYEKSLLMTKAEVDAAGRFLVETKLRMEAFLQGDEGAYNDTRVAFDSRIDIGPLNSEDKRMMQADVEKGRMSRQTYMNRVGTDDPDAELSLIRDDTSLATLKERLELFKAAKSEGLNVKAALVLAGFSDEVITKLLAADPNRPPNPNPEEGATGDAGLIA